MFSNTSKQRLATALAGAALASAMVVSSASADLARHRRVPPRGGRGPGRGHLPGPALARRGRRRPCRGRPPRVVVASPPSQDLRSPDTRDYANDYAPTLEPQPVADEPSAPSGFDFVSAAIGAIVAGALSLLLMATLGMRRQPGGRAASA